MKNSQRNIDNLIATHLTNRVESIVVWCVRLECFDYRLKKHPLTHPTVSHLKFTIKFDNYYSRRVRRHEKFPKKYRQSDSDAPDKQG